MQEQNVVSREEWIEARKAHLAKDKGIHPIARSTQR